MLATHLTTRNRYEHEKMPFDPYLGRAQDNKKDQQDLLSKHADALTCVEMGCVHMSGAQGAQKVRQGRVYETHHQQRVLRKECRSQREMWTSCIWKNRNSKYACTYRTLELAPCPVHFACVNFSFCDGGDPEMSLTRHAEKKSMQDLFHDIERVGFLLCMEGIVFP